MKAHFRNGRIELDVPVDIEEGTELDISVVPPLPTPRQSGRTLLERLSRVVGSVELPEDYAENHDHYLYGVPKR